MPFAARAFVILGLLTAAAATPASATTPYCQTIYVNTNVTGERTTTVLCGSAQYVFCQGAGKGGTPPAVSVEVCVPTPFPIRSSV